MTHPLATLGIQAARVLADVEALRRSYEPMIEEAGPELGPLLDEAAAALEQVVARTQAIAEDPPSG